MKKGGKTLKNNQKQLVFWNNAISLLCFEKKSINYAYFKDNFPNKTLSTVELPSLELEELNSLRTQSLQDKASRLKFSLELIK